MSAGGTEQRLRVVAGIALGANVGDVERTFRGALARLEQVPGVVVLRRSRWHRTAPVGGPPGQPDYLNGAVLVETTLDARALLDALQEIEARFGRDRANEERNGPRTLDLDLLFHGDARVAEPGLEVPHPRLEDRLFVLEPLEELAPDRVLPGSGVTVRERVRALREAAAPVRLADPAAARAWCESARARGASIGFVPTMGALHEGHLELVRRAADDNDVAVVSVFVNPLQFDDPADLERYPRDFEGDARLLAGARCAMVFTGTLHGFFPELGAGDAGLDPSRLLDPGPAARGLEGASRRGHFEGVATIVDRLFDVVGPTRAYFGQKDFQQTLVVRALAERRGGPEVVVHPTVRDADGLARSSRNALLTPEARRAGLALPRALRAARAAWASGERDPAALAAALRAPLDAADLDVAYAEVRDPDAWTAAAPAGSLARAVALVAARAGGVRLLDNSVLSGPDPALDAAGARP